MKFEDIKIGDKLVVVHPAGGMDAKKGDVVVVSDLSGWVYVEGNSNTSGKGQNAYCFEPYVEPKPVIAAIDWTKPLITKGGREVVLVTTQGRGDYPVVAYVGDNLNPSIFTKDGCFYDGVTSDHDLMNAPEKPKQRTVYLNVYLDGCSYGYNSRKDADVSSSSQRVACVKVVATEGQYDD